MTDFSTGKQKKKETAFDILERDVPVDVAHEWEESRFAQHYLEQQNQKSNIYFEQHQREQVAREDWEWRRTAPAHLVSRFSFVWRLAGAGVFGGIVLLSFFGVAWWWSGGVQAVPAFANARGVYEDMLSAQQAFTELRFEQALFSFHAVHERIVQRREQGGRALITYVQETLASLVHQGEGGVSTDAITLERNALSAAEKLTQGMEPLFRLSASSFFHTQNAYEGAMAGELIGDALLGVRDASTTFRKTQEALSEIKGDPALTDAVRANIGAFIPQISLAFTHTERLASYLKLGVWVLGVERPRKFLLVAQDSGVARPTGGAIRSVGVITTQGGAITDIVFDDVYGVDGQLQANIVPPEPIQRVATAWALHDANWFLDFPLSAKKIAYFYERSGGGAVDGVIAVNEQVVKKILKLTGPVKGDDGVLVNGENFSTLVRKDVLRALSNVLSTVPGATSNAFAQTLQESLREKDVLIWLVERDHQEMIVKEGWGGEIISEEGADYLAVVSSDIGSDAILIKEDIWKEVNIAENGDIINTVAVQFVPQEDGAQGEHERYMRIYVPKGSELLETSGITHLEIAPQIDYRKERFIVDDDLATAERIARMDDSGVRIFEESGKTVFGGWVTVGGKNTTAIVQYRLPFSFTKEVSPSPLVFIFQKQPGISAGIHFSLIVPEGMRAVDQEGNDLMAFSAEGKNNLIIQAIIK
ncbi:MAG: DUF4012 domain-containing protein [Candidatus Azambacteria bacterium]|nr:DUF4012 domain-containing protein [Candidatus Azambacteria bacterium]